MIILGLDTALGACSVAVVADGQAMAHRFQIMQRGHAEELAPMVQTAMREAGLDFSMLDRIAVTTGPGTFTGQRVGLAFARALALALKKPAIGITTLDAMAEDALTRHPAAWLAIVAADAKRGELYFGARSAKGETLCAPELILLQDIAARIKTLALDSSVPIALAGTAAEAVLPLLVQAGFHVADSLVRQPDAIFVAKLAAHAVAGAPPKPLYLREPDAKLPGEGW